MTSLRTSFAQLTMVDPNPLLHAPVTLSWFESEYGKETLLLMGNAEHEIITPTLDSEMKILEEFIDLRKANKQLTWMLQFKQEIVGVAWIELTENHDVRPPSIHLMIGNEDYRGKGIGKTTMLALIQYIKDNIKTPEIYSRHLKSNTVVANMNQRLGFTNEGASYTDDNGLEWQNVKLAV